MTEHFLCIVSDRETTKLVVSATHELELPQCELDAQWRQTHTYGPMTEHQANWLKEHATLYLTGYAPVLFQCQPSVVADTVILAKHFLPGPNERKTGFSTSSDNRANPPA